MTVSIIGGGRWARTIAGVLARLPEAPDTIILHSRRNASGIAEWIAGCDLTARLAVMQTWPDYRVVRPDALIVANRAADHADAAGPALDAGIAVLVEKPMAIGMPALQHLHSRATAGPSLLAASHVFLFARYFEAFAAVVPRARVTGLEMVWEDGRGDAVRGEAKSYDAAVAVFDDILPHVLPMLARLTGQMLTPQSISLHRGGAEVSIAAKTGHVPVMLRLGRNARGRCRRLVAQTLQGPYILDFSVEPGIISAPDGGKENGDPLWDSAPRPLGAMLAAFLRAMRGGALDPRLSPDLALASARFADALRPSYVAQRQEFLESRADAPVDAVAYVLQEMSGQA